LRKQQAPISFEHLEETNTQNFSRMDERINEQEREDPYVMIPKHKDVQENTVKHLLKMFV